MGLLRGGCKGREDCESQEVRKSVTVERSGEYRVKVMKSEIWRSARAFQCLVVVVDGSKAGLLRKQRHACLIPQIMNRPTTLLYNHSVSPSTRGAMFSCSLVGISIDASYGLVTSCPS